MTTYLVPVLTIVMSLVFLDEVPPCLAYVGGALALVGVAVARRTARTAPHSPDLTAMLARMSIVAGVLIGVVAALHLYFLVLEMFLWTTPAGRKAFGLDRRVRRGDEVVAANQGLYNGFLVAGLGWGLVSGEQDLRLFFLGCVVVAGLFGAATVAAQILVVQAVPAVLAAVAALLAYGPDRALG